MGLAERRRIATIKDQHAPRFQKELNDAVGYSLPFEIDLATFPEDAKVLDCYDYYYESYGPGLVVKVMKDICKDDMGKEAFKAKFDKIIFQNTAKSPDAPGDKSVTSDGRNLVIGESFYGYSDKLYGEDDLRKKLEDML